MTKPMPQTMTCAQMHGQTMPSNPYYQKYIPDMRRTYFFCTNSRGSVWPCLDTREWDRGPNNAIKRWRDDFNIRQHRPTPRCQSCSRPFCISLVP